MAPSTPNTPRRIMLTLDPGLVVERTILQRIDQYSRNRARDWLRSLLAQGFLTEARLLHTGVSQGSGAHPAVVPAASVTTDERWRDVPRAQAALTSSLPIHKEPAVTPVAKSRTTDKPLAHLRKVIG